ncbi:MAG: methionyl-tRNA synthetase, methionyl-tRNA synthetase [Parcubacteria group bacterium]|nr:methionyl-tRNA synthetase, methionyl-tRNA synthetase [Parcubacteria group bacterium]
MKTFYVTSPIFYPNAQPHLGHAYTTLVCDAAARAQRLAGLETYFLTGTDEHTEKVVKAAESLGESPDEYLEKIVTRFKALYTALDIQYDQFIRTSDKKVHWPGVIEMWARLLKSDDLYKSEYIGLYCIGCESFITEKELVNGLCPDHGTIPEKVSEENYFFRLSKYAPELKRLIEADEIRITPSSRKSEILNFIETGLQDVSFSRPKEKMTWGIPVPNDEAQTMYIWMDALTNYISALGFGQGEELMKFWPGTHVIGKDILRFHSLFWPAMLLSAGLPLPKEIFVHGTIISDGQKMSKSIGNVIDPNDLIKKYGTDATRYLLLRHVHSTEDTDITWERLDEWYLANLVNGLGNLVARVMKLAETHLESPIARPEESPFTDEYWAAINTFNFHQALDLVWTRIQGLDERITREEPFKLVKTDVEAGKALIAELATELYQIARLLNPIMPATNELIKAAVLANKKPENLFPRLNP